MNILDENIPESQRQLLRSWRVSVRQIGHDVGYKGIKDHEIIPFLHSLRRPTFFTRDLGFYERRLCHAQYCLVCMAVGQYETATFIRRLLRHSEFSTQAKRMGAVIRVSHSGLRVWRLHAEEEVALSWDK
jgi:hypothetical protein